MEEEPKVRPARCPDPNTIIGNEKTPTQENCNGPLGNCVPECAALCLRQLDTKSQRHLRTVAQVFD